MKKTSQSGSAIIIVMATLFVVGVVGFVGWRVYDKTTTKKVVIVSPAATPKAASVETNSNKSASADVAQQTNNQGYLVIKEWGVKIPTSEKTSGMTYSLGANYDGVLVTTDALKAVSDSTCTANNVVIVRGKASNKVPSAIDDPSNPTFSQAYSSSVITETDYSYHSFKVKIGEYYYLPPNFGGASCAKSSSLAQQEQDAIAEIVKAVRNIQ
jgi:hypothetical protein